MKITTRERNKAEPDQAEMRSKILKDLQDGEIAKVLLYVDSGDIDRAFANQILSDYLKSNRILNFFSRW